MKKLTISILSATALAGLSACGTEDVETEETVIVGEGELADEGDMVAEEPVAEDGDSISIGTDGVSADVDGVSVEADAEGNATLTVE